MDARSQRSVADGEVIDAFQQCQPNREGPDLGLRGPLDSTVVISDAGPIIHLDELACLDLLNPYNPSHPSNP